MPKRMVLINIYFSSFLKSNFGFSVTPPVNHHVTLFGTSSQPQALFYQLLSSVWSQDEGSFGTRNTENSIFILYFIFSAPPNNSRSVASVFYFFISFWRAILIFGWIVDNFLFFFLLGRSATASSLYIVQLHSLMGSQTCIHSWFSSQHVQKVPSSEIYLFFHCIIFWIT